MSEPDAPPTIIEDPRRRTLVLVAVCLALMLVVAGVSMLNLAIPDVTVDLGASRTDMQWIIDAYTVVLAALLLPMGAVSDRWGRRWTLIGGIGVLAVAAAGAALSDSTTQLIAARALMGVGAALVMPSTLATITSVYPPESRAKAVGIWAGVAGAGANLGVLAAGLLLEWFSWRSLFVFSATFAVISFAVAWFVVPNTKDPAHANLDFVGAALSLVGIGALVTGIIEGPERGWSDALTVAALTVGIVAITAWILWSLRIDKPLLDFRFFKLRGFATGSASLFFQFFAMFGFFIVALQFLQLILGFGTLKAALSLLPMAIVIMPVSAYAATLAQRYGQRLIGALGLSITAFGFLIIALMDVSSNYWHFLFGLFFTGIGMALAMTPATDAIVGSLPPAKQGVASAVNDTARELGAAFGIAVIGSAFNTGYGNSITEGVAGLPPEMAEVAKEAPASAFVVAGQMGEAGLGLLSAAREAFMVGSRWALLSGALVLVIGALFVIVRAPRKADDPEVNLDDTLDLALDTELDRTHRTTTVTGETAARTAATEDDPVPDPF